jgi:hypothetical protein
MATLCTSSIIPFLTNRGAALSIATVFLTAAPMANAQDATAILKQMSDYVGAEKTVSITFDASVEVVTHDFQKVQFASSGTALLSRPNKLRITRTGGYSDVELVFDGKTVTVFGKNINAYAQADSPGTVDQLIDAIRDHYNIAVAGADLLAAHVGDVMTTQGAKAAHIGQGVIGGVECEHLAFRGDDTDWQLWVRTGEQPIPCKYVVTSKQVVGSPQYTIRIREWRTANNVGADAFTFKPPADAKRVEFSDLRDIDEIPNGQLASGEKQ